MITDRIRRVLKNVKESDGREFSVVELNKEDDIYRGGNHSLLEHGYPVWSIVTEKLGTCITISNGEGLIEMADAGGNTLRLPEDIPDRQLTAEIMAYLSEKKELS
jgi:hypothetical protein